MNYYLARDGKTYGPYPQEYIPAMVQQGQLTPEDLLCPQGGNEWTPLSQLPDLLTPTAAPAAAAPAASGGGLRMSVTQPAHAAAAASPATTAYAPAAQPARTSSGLGGAGRILKLAGFAVVAVLVLGGLITGFLATQRDRKEIAKLHSLPGWNAFDAANHQIDSESSNAGYGNTSEATAISTKLAGILEEVQRENFKVDRTPRYRGRSKIARVTSTVSAATAGTGHFQTFVELRKDRAVVLVHIPEFKRYKGEARQAITEMCWEGALVMLSQLQKEDEEKARASSIPAGAAALAGSPAAPPARPPGSRTPPGRPAPGRAPANRPAAAAPARTATPMPKAEPKFSKDLPIVVGVRGRSAYECVYVGAITNPEDSPPTSTKKNVPSHQLLVKWFGEEKP